ncbi:hypothetical protein GNI_130670 [Gregarina niphandrodes]|uniref:Uncharacterized protein n=1 Tax=Gregarina niphandrodes TaxID=110365 RepID=A0A023B1G3_GRENI|nr:hypothetical protein GNI_130670 [Gregarina niphandrodes]EZG47686.1 hypothetical protein GNI_130670 [Gregarina niphandrodes]|eukprot:XP_011132152.1 hypothetical protein GNI_130670 [Gregarina niphandrodes]
MDLFDETPASSDVQSEDSSSSSEQRRVMVKRRRVAKPPSRAVVRRPRSSTTQELWDRVVARLDVWHKANREYTGRMDEYLRDDFELDSGRVLLKMEYDLRKISPNDMLTSLFRDIFKTGKPKGLVDISDMLTMIAEAGDDNFSPKFRIRTDEAKTDDWETIILFPRTLCKRVMDYIDRLWFGPLLQKIILAERALLQDPVLTSDDSPVITKAKHRDPIDDLLPRTPSGFLFSQDLHQIRGLPKTSQLRTVSAPIQALVEIKNCAYGSSTSQ